ncbi:bifunctional glutamine synthetase adenylyltransferase/deadenyltransferase, partial [Acinetobacter baumannii]
MNAEQLQKTLRASKYAEQVLGLNQAVLEQDYQIDQFAAPLSTKQIYQLVDTTLDGIGDEIKWMRALRILRSRLMFRWIWQDA